MVISRNGKTTILMLPVVLLGMRLLATVSDDNDDISTWI